MTSQEQQGWKERFEQEFGHSWTQDNFPHPSGVMNWIDALLASQAQKHREEVERLFDETKVKCDNDYYEDCNFCQLKRKVLAALKDTGLSKKDV